MTQPLIGHEKQAMAHHKPAHIVICGYSRSGTTLFYNMLRTTVQNFKFLDRECRAANVIGDTLENYVTKRPLDLFDVENIVRRNQYGKALKVIVMIRDIRAVMTSRHKSVPDDYFVGFDHQYFIDGKTASFSNPGILATHHAISLLMRSNLAPIVIRYEDLLRRTDDVQQDLGRRLGFVYEGRFARFFEHEIPEGLQRALNGQRPLDPENIEAWRADRHRDRIRQQFMACPALFSILRAYGYEKDDRWFDTYRSDEPVASSQPDTRPR